MPGKSGFNLYLLPGYLMRFKRDDVDGVDQPLIDLGTIKSVTPNFSAQNVELYDGRGGKKNKVDEALIQMDEVYDVEVNNMSLRNQALLYSANPPEAYTQANDPVEGASHVAHVGELLKLLKANGDPIFNVESVDYVTNTRRAITAVNVGTKKFTVAGDHVTEYNVAGKKVLVSDCTGMTPTTQLLTIVGAALNAGNTEIEVSEAITGATVAGTIARAWDEDTDWEIVNLVEGVIRIMPGSTITEGATLLIDYTMAAVSGKRIIKPQTGGAAIRGKAYIVCGNNNNEDIFIRHCRVSITPSGNSGSVEEFAAISLRVAVLNDLNDPVPAGELVHASGEVPDLS